MDQTLGFLRESLSNWAEGNEYALELFRKLESNQYKNEIEFVKDLSEEEVIYLNNVLPQELDYARNEQDELRYKQLNTIYEQLI